MTKKIFNTSKARRMSDVFPQAVIDKDYSTTTT